MSALGVPAPTMGLSLSDLDPPLDDVAYLARSNHRVTVLTELAAGPTTRRELRDATGISQPTLGRVLDGFAARDWVREDAGRTYALTPLGRLLAEEFGDLLDTVETTQALRELAPSLPLETFDFDLRRLADARITVPTATDASAHLRRERELLEGAGRIRFLCNEANPDTVRAYRDRVVEQGQHIEVVIAADTVDVAVDDPLVRDYLRDFLETGRASFYRYDGPVSVMLGRLDDVATIVPIDDRGVPCGLVESTDPEVRAWVDETIDARRADATPLALEDLAA